MKGAKHYYKKLGKNAVANKDYYKKIVGETFTGYNSGLSHASEAACLKSCDDSTICDGFLYA